MKIGDTVKVTITATVMSVDKIAFELQAHNELEYYFEFADNLEIEVLN